MASKGSKSEVIPAELPILQGPGFDWDLAQVDEAQAQGFYTRGVDALTHGNTNSTRIAPTVRTRPPVTAFASGRRNRDGSRVGRNPEANAAVWAPHDGRWTIPM